MYEQRIQGWVNKQGKLETRNAEQGRGVCFRVFNARHVPIYKPRQKISWGQPAEITQAVMDRQCPRCSAVQGDGFIDKHKHIIPGGFDLGEEKGRVFGCLCFNCGFSF